MDYAGSVHVLERLCHLIDYEANMYIFQDSLGYHIMKVCLHELKNQVNIFIVIGFDGIDQFYYIGVIQLFQNLYLTVCSLGICRMLKSIKNLFEGIYFFSGFFLYFPDMPVCTGPYFLQDVESSDNMILNEGCVVLRHLI